jgi:hypothetical protein
MYGTIKIIDNKDASACAKSIYNAICVYNELGEYETLLLTENDLIEVRFRASKNPEDCVKLSAVTTMVLRLLRILRIL